ncbi:MAG: Gfo/Idh/MocA family oxidoreductase [Candidatus Hinthialibacter antarcticus]|nr:Gfo/Idh/MocA family oxidoreductase [Candidatus Hinthialibacter antarcticus]
MPNQSNFSRRNFLKSTFAAPMFISASAMGTFGNVAPSNRIVMGCIGVGSQGTGDMRNFMRRDEAYIRAVCDVDGSHRKRAKQSVDEFNDNSDCAAYVDFRELLERDDLDAVLIAVPDHWHALPAIAAAKRGLDVYGEKPLSRSIRESRAICDAVRRYGRVWQTGSQQRSEGNFQHACELVRNEKIGAIHTVEVGLPGGGSTDLKPTKPAPEDLDWDRWLGPAPWREYCDFGRDRCHWDWRWIMDYSGGQLTDWAGHHIDIAHWGMGYDQTGPVEISGSAEYPREGLYDTATSYSFVCKYKTGVTINISSSNRGGTKWIGENGWVWVNRGAIEASDENLLKKDCIGPNDTRLYQSRDHFQNFLDCVKSRQETICPAETGCRSISVGHLGEITMLLNRKIRWNPDTETIIDDPEANALLGRAYRKPWTLA